MTVTEQLTELLKEHNLGELALVLGVGRRTLERFASGALVPSVKVIRKMALLAKKTSSITLEGYEFHPKAKEVERTTGREPEL